MRRLVNLFLFYMLILCGLTGCNSTKQVNNGDVTEFEYYFANGRIANDADKNIYFFAKMTNTDGYFLYCYNNDNMTEAKPVCSKKNCTHNTNLCDAYYSSDECVGKNIWIQNGRIYRLKRDKVSGKICLESQNKDGSNIIKEAELWSAEDELIESFWDNCFVLEKEKIYYVIKRDGQEYISAMESGREIGKFDYKIDKYVLNSCKLVYSRGSIYYFAIYYDDSEAQLNIRQRIYCYNTEEKSFSMIHEENGVYDINIMVSEDGQFTISGDGFSGIDFTYTVFDNYGKMYSWGMLNGNLRQINISDWTYKDLNNTDSWGRIRYDGNSLILDNIDSGTLYGNVRKIESIDLNTMEKKEILFASDEFSNVYCYGGNENFMLFIANVKQNEDNSPYIIYYDCKENTYYKILQITGSEYDMINDLY